MTDYIKTPLQTVFDVTQIVNISCYKLAPNYTFAGERHAFWEFLYVDRGSIIVTGGVNKYLLQSGEMVFHCPDEFHSFQSTGCADVIVASFCCDSPAMSQLNNKVLSLHQSEKQCMKLLIAEAALSFAYFDNNPPRVNMRKKPSAPFASDQLIKTCLEQLFIFICRRNDNRAVEQSAVTSNQLCHHLQIVQQTQDYLADHYAEAISLERLAAHLHISASLLKRVFREQTNTTVISYLTALRISEAKRLIRESNGNFTEIAAQVGYNSIYYFSNIFKKRTGMSLTDYAKSLKE